MVGNSLPDEVVNPRRPSQRDPGSGQPREHRDPIGVILYNRLFCKTVVDASMASWFPLEVSTLEKAMRPRSRARTR
jgi:hypothetical protein